MIIAFIIPSNAKTAPNLIAKSIIKKLLDDGHTVKVFARKLIEKNDLNLPITIEVFSPRNIKKFKQFEIIHSMGFFPDLLNAFLKFTRISKKSKSITTLHSDFDKDLFDLYSLSGLFLAYFWWFLIFFLDARVFINNNQLNRLPFFKLKKNNVVIYNGIDIKENKEFCLNKKNEKGKVLYCGTIRKIKGFDILMKAVAYDNLIKVDVAGQGKGKFFEDSKKFISENGISSNINFLGHLEDTENLYEKYNILVVPSRSEGFGLVILEALAKNVTVICNDIPVFREIFKEYPIIFYKENCHIDLAKKIKNEISKNKKTEMKHKLIKDFSSESMSEKYIEIYSSI